MDALQRKVFDFLGDPLTHGVSSVRRCDTHAAVVFLAGDTAFKVKRAVQFPFLDYSTLAKRKAACLAELEVNRRFAPEIYRKVVPIVRGRDGRLTIGGDGETVEWALEMMRFDENNTLDHLADRRQFSEQLASQLAVTIAALHEASPQVEAAPWIKGVEDYLNQNTTAFRQHEPLFKTAQIDELDNRSRTTWDRLRPLLVKRGKLGLVRRGHGDLHLGNIVLLHGQPVAFDAIEFDPIIASGDVLYDLAFPLMDLIERDLVAQANLVMNGYLQASRRDDDYEGLAALPFFMSLRAAIRAKVTAARIANVPEAERPAIARAAARYFALAHELLAPAPPPAIIAIGGLSGTGKSVLARALAPCFAPPPGAIVLRSDVERKNLFSVRETERLPAHGYQADVTAQVYANLSVNAARLARAGYSVIIDAVFANPSERTAIETTAHDADIAFYGLFLTANLNARLQRAKDRRLDASDADAAVVLQQESYDIGHMMWNVIDATGSPPQTRDAARACLNKTGLLASKPERR